MKKQDELRRSELLKRNVGEADGAEERLFNAGGCSCGLLSISVCVQMMFEFYSENQLINKREF
jgi:hypothetical protein